MVHLRVLAPQRSASEYVFTCLLEQPDSPTQTVRFGYRADNFEIRHAPQWDSIYPLMYLTRNGGPLFRKHERARISFDYPIHEIAKDFYVRRATDFGITLDVEAEYRSDSEELRTQGSVLAFGGGKDSRMVLGLLRELGQAPTVVTSGAENAKDIANSLSVTPIHGVLADRLMPGLMQGGRHYYHGSGLGEVHRETPWQQYYDWGSPHALAETSGMLSQLGVHMHMHAPVSVVPYNLVQRILSERYPDLYAHQVSVKKNGRSEKTLQVALCKTLHGIGFDRECTEEVFQERLASFVRRNIDAPEEFGHRNHRETIIREMRAIIHRCRDQPRFAAVANVIPAHWAGDWINYVHTYVWPETSSDMLAIYGEYAQDFSHCPYPDHEYRVIA